MTGHHTDPDFGMFIDKAASHGITVKIMHQNDISVFIGTENVCDLVVKNPGSARFQGAAFAFF